MIMMLFSDHVAYHHLHFVHLTVTDIEYIATDLLIPHIDHDRFPTFHNSSDQRLYICVHAKNMLDLKRLMERPMQRSIH